MPPAETPLGAGDGRRWRHLGQGRRPGCGRHPGCGRRPGLGRHPGVGLVRLGAGENRVIEHQQVQALFPVDLVNGREEHATRVDAHQPSLSAPWHLGRGGGTCWRGRFLRKSLFPDNFSKICSDKAICYPLKSLYPDNFFKNCRDNWNCSVSFISLYWRIPRARRLPARRALGLGHLEQAVRGQGRPLRRGDLQHLRVTVPGGHLAVRPEGPGEVPPALVALAL